MPRSLLLAVLAVLLAAPASARANTVRLWGCHGPDGAPLPFSYEASLSAGATVTDGCRAPEDAIRLAFSAAPTPRGAAASLRFGPPAGVSLARVALGRDASGPGYWAGTSQGPLETVSAGRELEQDATGSYVELGLRCEQNGCDMGEAFVDLRYARLDVRDEARPAFELESLKTRAAGALEFLVNARDDGLGVASVHATLGGAVAETVAAGGRYCRELSPQDATIDLPLADDCPASTRVKLSLDTTRVADGVHALDVVVADGAGNATGHRYEVTVVNNPNVDVPAPAPPTSPGPYAVAPTPAVAALKLAKRYKVTRAGTVTVRATCPAGAKASCPVRLSLTAQLPGAKNRTTISRTAKRMLGPGARANVKLKLSLRARRALRKHALSAQLTLAGVRTTTVKLAR